MPIAKIYEDAKDKMASEKQTIKSNQSELKSQLGDLIDTQKYLHLIEEENHRLRLEREKGEKGDFAPKDTPSYANVQRRSASTRIISYKMASRWRMRKRPRGFRPRAS